MKCSIAECSVKYVSEYARGQASDTKRQTDMLLLDVAVWYDEIRKWVVVVRPLVVLAPFPQRCSYSWVNSIPGGPFMRMANDAYDITS